MGESHFTDPTLDYVVTGTQDVGDRRRTVSFVWRDGRRSSITIDTAWDSPEIRDKMIRAWATMPRTHGSTRRVSGEVG